MKLHGFRGTRSSRVEWMLLEAGASYEFNKIDLMTGQHKQPAHLELHPHGLVPVFEDGDLRIVESSAAVLYLADKFADKKLAPAPGTAARGRLYELAVYAASTIDETVIPAYFHAVLFPPDRRDASIVEQKKKVWAIVAKVLEPRLGDQPYFLGSEFSAADVIVGYSLALAGAAGFLSDYPKLAAYVQRITARECYQKAHARG